MIELYTERIFDLLCPKADKQDFRIKQQLDRCDKKLHQSVTSVSVCNVDEFKNLVTRGIGRLTNTWRMYKGCAPPRADIIGILNVTQQLRYGKKVKSSLRTVMLCGSERIQRARNLTHGRGVFWKYNSTLTSLNKCIDALADNTFVPYRESCLTWFMRKSLGGDSTTAFIHHCGPEEFSKDESIKTLLHAAKAKKIRNSKRIRMARAAFERDMAMVFMLEKEIITAIGSPSGRFQERIGMHT